MSTAVIIVPETVNKSRCTFSVLVVCHRRFLQLHKYMKAQNLHKFSDPPSEHNDPYVGRRAMGKIPERRNKYVGQFWPFFAAVLGVSSLGFAYFF